jgi:hypothetical protein
MIAAHRVQRYLHHLLLLFRGHDFTALIVAAVRADTVRQYRLVALRTVLDLQGFDVKVASAFSLAGM